VVTDPTSPQSQWVALAQPNETLSDEAVYRLRPSKDVKRMGDCWIPRPQKHSRIFLFWLIRRQPVATCPLTLIPWPSLDLSRRHQPAGVGAHSLTLNSVLSLPYYVLVLMPVVRHSSWGWRWRPNTSHQPLASSCPSSRMSSLAFTGPYWIPPEARSACRYIGGRTHARGHRNTVSGIFIGEGRSFGMFPTPQPLKPEGAISSHPTNSDLRADHCTQASLRPVFAFFERVS
jgi:hypothetical protein